MRIARNSGRTYGEELENQSSEKLTYTNNTVYNQTKILSTLFEKVLFVNPLDKAVLKVNEYKLEDINTKCTDLCPLAKDECGCICKDTISTRENRSRFIFNKSKAYLVISKLIPMKYRNYTMVLIMRLDPTFAFGAYAETEAINEITKLSSNLVIDPLTNIFNRKYLMDNIEYMIDSAFRKRIPLCMACIDVDNFKRFNDTYGHDFGDIVLKTIAKLMEKSISSLDEAYAIRIGGDEFVIIAINVYKTRFKALMSKLCFFVEDTKLDYNKEKVGIKISIGVAELIEDRVLTYKDLYDRADRQLYAAKEAGKGCVR